MAIEQWRCLLKLQSCPCSWGAAGKNEKKTRSNVHGEATEQTNGSWASDACEGEERNV